MKNSNQKLLRLILLFAMGLFAEMPFLEASVNSLNPASPMDSEPVLNGDETIILQGCLDYGANPDDIEASVINNTVNVNFRRNFGFVNISLYDGNGLLIHSSVVNTATQQSVAIPISSGSSGTYTLVLNNNRGVAEGYFER